MTLSDSLVQPLFDGPLDLIGDVHGEIDALRSLMERLGYNDDGTHPEKRRLVFLGDLTDRGPDSPAVVDLVQRLLQSGCAQCVLGNHDLNILRYERKHDNHWFFGEPWSLNASDEHTPAVLADDNIRKSVLEFFATLPLVLERHDLRVVHACWDDAAVAVARESDDAVALFNAHDAAITVVHENSPLDAIGRGLQRQNLNPVKVLTSGKERRVTTPFEASGKLRYEERVPWWEDYNAQPLCMFGHYSMDRTKANFTTRAICADFAVAKRWKERKEKALTEKFLGCLAAVRLPEHRVIFDNGGETRSFCFPQKQNERSA